MESAKKYFPHSFYFLRQISRIRDREKMKKGKAKGNTEAKKVSKTSLNKDFSWPRQEAMIIYNRKRHLSLIMISCILRTVVNLLCAREDCHLAV